MDRQIDPKYYAYRELSYRQRLFGHIKTVCTHKKYVRYGCFRMGLYLQGIFHDMSKFSPVEFHRSVMFYSGQFSPNSSDRMITGCSISWMHHKGRNRHHYEYWTDYTPSIEPYIMGCKMPLKYVAEMVADRYAACVAYNKDTYSQGDAWKYYARSREHIVMHDDTRLVLEQALSIMRDEGEDVAFAYMKGLLKITKGRDYTAESLGIDSTKIVY